MYLKSLVLKGFKSFADKSSLVLEPGVTAIVGPNGSGKSNISDAVLWVLGERNARNLRGQSMEDVIFAGSSSRKAVNVAEVELVLDNSDGTLPVDFAEVSIGRRMFRTGESEYLINGVQARRMDVLEILHDSGLGTGTHSIISQGHLDSILESKPEDRRALIEEAAGVLKHKQRKQKSQRKLERMDQHLTRIFDITNEVERQIKPLERKAKKAMAYQELTGKLSQLTLQLAVDDLRALQVQWDDTLRREGELRQQISILNDQAFAADSKVREQQRILMEKAEGSQKTESSFHAMRNVSERIEGTLRVLREKKRSVLRSREERIRDLDSNKLRIEELELELAQAGDQEQQIAFELKTAESGLAEKRERQQGAQSKLDICEREIRTLEKEERKLSTQLEVLREKQLQMSQAYQDRLADTKLVDSRRQDMMSQLEDAQDVAAMLAEQLEQSDESLAELQERESQARQATALAMDALQGARNNASEARQRKSVADAQVSGAQARERQRRAGNKARSWMTREESGVACRELMSIMQVPKELEGLVELLLGDAVDALLVDEVTNAREALAQVSGQEMTGSLYVVPSNGRFASAKPSQRRLLDKLTFPQDFQAQLEILLGDVRLCDSLDEALSGAEAQVSGQLRFATKDGYVVDSSGMCMYRRKDQGAVGAVEQHQELVAARKDAEQAAAELEEAEKAAALAEASMREAQKISLDLTGSLASARGDNKSLADRVRAQDSVVVELTRQLRDLEQKKEQAKAALEKLKPSRDMVELDLQKTSEELATAKASLAQYRDGVGELRRDAQDASSILNEAKLAVATLTERNTYAKRVTFGRRQTLDTAKARISRLERYLASSVQIPARIDVLLESFETLYSSLMGWIGRLDSQMQQAKSQASEDTKQLDQVRFEARALHQQQDAANDKMSDIRVEKGRLEVQVENATNAIVKDCGVALEVALEVPALEDRQAAIEESESLRRRISNMGTINPDAAEEYEQLKERYDFLKSQVEDMMNARRSLEKIVRIIDERMRNDFATTFEQVNENFKRIFADLFPGGSAGLRLCDESDLENTGVEIEAQPLGKKVAKTSLMSGGEKSLIAMALLMAVYQTRSTPFYILDEVEAALDDTNLRRLCSCLDMMRQDTQLLIITHQRRTMEMADVLYGISMQNGSTKLVSQRLDREKISKGA